MSVVGAFMVPHPPMIVPDIGKGSERQVEKTIRSYERVAEKIAELKPETIIISSPHSVMYSDYFHISSGRGARGSFANFGAGNVKFDVSYDTELVEQIANLASETYFPAGFMGEKDPLLDHGTMVPLYYITKKYSDFKLIRTGLSGLDLYTHYEYGMLLKKAIEAVDRRVVYVASGDLSHKLQDYGPYGFVSEGPMYDERIMDVCARADFGEMLEFEESFLEKSAECGHRSFVIMAGVLDGQDVVTKVYSHEDITGVGYGVCSFLPYGESESRKFLKIKLREKEGALALKREESDDYVKLARESLEYFVKRGKVLDIPEWVPLDTLTRQAGTFVSVHKMGQLRGCIGTILPTKDNLAEEIIHNAISAASKDYRFSPITEDELKWLDINVDVLSEPERIASTDELDVKRYGVIVESGYKRGLLLPDLEGVDTVEEQVSIAMRKGGIRPEDKIQLYRFEVVRHI